MANITIPVSDITVGDTILERNGEGRIVNRIPVQKVHPGTRPEDVIVNKSLRYDRVCSVEVRRG